jgi:hypothetical protein
MSVPPIVGTAVITTLRGLCELGEAVYEDVKPVIKYYSNELDAIGSSTSEEFFGFIGKMIPRPDVAPGRLWKDIPGDPNDYNDEIDISIMRPFEELAGQSVLWTLLTLPVTIPMAFPEIVFGDCGDMPSEDLSGDVDVTTVDNVAEIQGK